MRGGVQYQVWNRPETQYKSQHYRPHSSSVTNQRFVPASPRGKPRALPRHCPVNAHLSKIGGKILSQRFTGFHMGRKLGKHAGIFFRRLVIQVLQLPHIQGKFRILLMGDPENQPQRVHLLSKAYPPMPVGGCREF